MIFFYIPAKAETAKATQKRDEEIARLHHELELAPDSVVKDREIENLSLKLNNTENEIKEKTVSLS